MTWRCKSSRHTWMNGTQRSDDQQQTHMRELAGHQCSSAMLQLPGTQLQCCEPAMASRLYITNIDHAPQVEMLVMHIHCAACTTRRLYKTMPARQCYLVTQCLQINKLWLYRAHILRYPDMALHLGMLTQARQSPHTALQRWTHHQQPATCICHVIHITSSEGWRMPSTHLAIHALLQADFKWPWLKTFESSLQGGTDYSAFCFPTR